MTKFFSIGLLVFFLTSCVSMQLRGEFTDASDSFEGKIHGSLSDSGKLSFVTKSGTLCEGTYKFIEGKKLGKGLFSCLDKTTGDFTFTSDATFGTSGKGSGKTNKNQHFTFVFGG